MKLFEIAKVGCFCDGVNHSLEKRRGEDVKVLTLTLRVAPFSASHATAMPDGVKPTLFKLNSGDPKETLRRVDFALGIERQILHIFAAPDTSKATRAIDQVRIHGTYARMPKDSNAFDFVFRATFGPVGRDELEFVQGWLLSQKFISFEAAEPGMFDLETEETDEDDDEPSSDRPADMWEDGDEQNPSTAAANSDTAAEGPEPARHAKPRHATRASAAKAKQADKGKKR